MQKFFYARIGLVVLFFLGLIFIVSCGQPATNPNAVQVNSNTNSTINTNINSSINSSTNANVSNTSAANIESKEPSQYQAKITLRFEAAGNQQQTALPNVTANIARNGEDRRMEFTLPNNEKVIYLDKPDNKYLLLPNRKQYALLDKDSLGFEIRQMMMPAEIINRFKAAPGVERVGEENYNGRQVIRYRYGATTNTQTQAGQVNTESFFLVDKETGLLIRSETVSSSQTGNVQGFNNLRIVTDMTDISNAPAPEQFAAPTDFQKIDAEQVKAQVNLIFNTAALLLNQALKSAQSNSNTNANLATPTASPSANK
jgi:hypothetical protein